MEEEIPQQSIIDEVVKKTSASREATVSCLIVTEDNYQELPDDMARKTASPGDRVCFIEGQPDKYVILERIGKYYTKKFGHCDPQLERKLVQAHRRTIV